MRSLLAVSRGIDWFNERLAVIANLTIIAICVISAGNAAVRYAFSYSSNTPEVGTTCRSPGLDR